MKLLCFIVSVFLLVLMAPSAWSTPPTVPTAPPTPGTVATTQAGPAGPPIESTFGTPPVSTVSPLYGTTASNRNYANEVVF